MTRIDREGEVACLKILMLSWVGLRAETPADDDADGRTDCFERIRENAASFNQPSNQPT